MVKLNRFLLLRSRPALTRAGRNWGFTAIELTAVATIIALLALILLPNVRSRVRQARVVTAQDDMRTIEIAEVLAFADTGFYVRLSDLDNTTPPDLAAISDLGASTLPLAQWNGVFPGYTDQPTTVSIGSAFASKWNGPYTNFPDSKFIPLYDLIAQRPTMTRILVVTAGTAVLPAGLSGPILIIEAEAVETGRREDLAPPAGREERTPLDPWGSPYIFFGPGRMNVTEPFDSNFETNFAGAVVYTMGPDGLPGDGTGSPTEVADYLRGGTAVNKLGQGDDLKRSF